VSSSLTRFTRPCPCSSIGRAADLYSASAGLARDPGSSPGGGIGKRVGSSVGQSSRLLSERSRVQVSPDPLTRNSSEAERRPHKPLAAGSSPASATMMFASVLVYLSWQRVRLLIGRSLVRVQPPEPKISGESLNLERSLQRAPCRRRGSGSRSLFQGMPIPPPSERILRSRAT
jgi:hypothetical protein